MNVPFYDCDVPRRLSYGVYMSQLIRFTRVFSHVEDFNARKMFSLNIFISIDKHTVYK